MSDVLDNTTDNTTVNPTITFNDKVYQIDSLPAEVQEFITIHQVWNTELATARREVFKFEAAIRGLLIELEHRFTSIDGAKDAPVADAPVADAPVADAPVADAPVADAPAPAPAPVADAPVAVPV